jgi:hypothetical protein
LPLFCSASIFACLSAFKTIRSSVVKSLFANGLIASTNTDFPTADARASKSLSALISNSKRTGVFFLNPEGSSHTILILYKSLFLIS